MSYELEKYVGMLGEMGNRDQLNMICDRALDHYAVNCLDIRKCPSLSCKNLGYIGVKPCSSPLKCD